jgi:hypothetical protein
VSKSTTWNFAKMENVILMATAREPTLISLLCPLLKTSRTETYYT